MKYYVILMIYFLLIVEGNSENNNYNYANYNAASINRNLTGDNLNSTDADHSVAYINKTGISISSSTLEKLSGNSSNIENSEFYGINAAVLVQGGEVTITNGTITTNATGANAVCATNSGNITISGTTIKSTSPSSGRGLHATYGGSIEANNVTISSTGGSCATLATDRGEGTVTCSDCALSTEGAGSPLIYSTGNITINNTTGTSNGAQCVVVEGKNTATVKGNSYLKCSGIGNRNDTDKCGVMLYQSQSGDAETGTSTFNCENSALEILSSSKVNGTAPMFFITNTKAAINLENCNFTYNSRIFLSAKGTSEWGTSPNNGGNVTLTLTNQNIEGNIEIDSNSSLVINIINSSITGTINGANNTGEISINLDNTSSIILTGNSYISSLNNSNSSGINVNVSSFNFSYYNGTSVNTSSYIPYTEEKKNNTNNETQNNSIKSNKIILLGFDNFKYNRTEKNITFNCYFINTMNEIFKRVITLFAKINYKTLRFLQEEYPIRATCTLNNTGSNIQIKYDCTMETEDKDIDNIEISNILEGNSKNQSFDEINVFALDAMKNLKNSENSTFDKPLYYLQDSEIVNNTNTAFIINGTLSDNISLNENIKLNYNFTNKNNEVEKTEADCTLTKTISDNVCSLKCMPKKLTNGTLGSGFSILQNGNLFVDFKDGKNNIENVRASYSGVNTFRRNKRGLNGGAITAIVLSIVAVLAIIGVLYFLTIKPSLAPVNEKGIINSDSKVNIN